MNIKKREYYCNLLREGILNNFHKMLREPEGILKRPYLDPSGPYGKQLWDWDSYFATKTLFAMLKDRYISKKISNISKEQIIAHIKGAFLNFFDNQADDGTISIMLSPENVDLFKCREKNLPDRPNMAKPVFGQYLMTLLDNTGEITIAQEVFSKLLLFYECYRKYYFDKNTGLFVWGSDIAIGVDDDPTTWARPPLSSANILLNCLMYADLSASAKIALKLGKTRDYNNLDNYSEELKSAILKYCWDKRDGFFYTVDVQSRKQIRLGWIHKNLDSFWQALPLKVMVWTGFLPLYVKICTSQQAIILVKKHLFNEKRFLSKYGISSLSKDEIMYQPEIPRGNPSNWLGPVWILTNYLIWEGLKNYGFKKEAGEIAGRVIYLLGRDIEKNGCLHEYYSPETGKGVHGNNFWNWNNLVLYMM